MYLVKPGRSDKTHRPSNNYKDISINAFTDITMT